jgi:hypothetical protein
MAVFMIQIRRFRYFLGLPDPNPLLFAQIRILSLEDAGGIKKFYILTNLLLFRLVFCLFG